MTVPSPEGERILPAGPVGAYMTFGMTQPGDTMVRAVCEQVSCEAYLNGWETAVDERTDLGMMQAAYIRQRSGRTFREMRTGEGLTVFRFESGQRCFAEHRTRPQRHYQRPGDWRGQTGPAIAHSPAGWQEAFAENQERLLKERLE